MEKETDKWFKDWFDSKYYHLLYSNRNHSEAAYFIDNLFNKLHLPPHSKILDIACGKGRHAIHVHSFGHDVTGIDLSAQSIAFAKKFEEEGLHFFVHDMRAAFKPDTFDVCLNLFTSFGYFLKDSENQKSICAMAQNLKKKGKLVLDYLNVEKALQNIPEKEVKEVDGMQFSIQKEEWNGFIRKSISFEVEGESQKYYEYVKIISKDNFNAYFENAGLRILEVFGDYSLKKFELEQSNRLIFIAEKI